MNNAKFVNIARLMTTYNFEIEQLPDNLKCAKCKLVLKDACLVSCGCTYCRICNDDMISSGIEFCLGDSEVCRESSLSRCLSDYRTNNIISKITVKCPNNGCVHECQLINMEEHLRECPRKNVECPFRELGCEQDNLAAEEMNDHLLQQNRRHSEILIRMVANINREIETLKQGDEDSKREIEILKQRDEDSKREIEVLKQRDEDSKREIEVLKHEVVLKDGQIRTIIDQMIHLENENKSIAAKNEDLADRVTILQEKIEREINERRESDELDSVRVIEHVDREIAAISTVIGSIKDDLATEVRSVREDIQSINQGTQSIKDDICSMKSQVESIQALVGQVDATCVFVIEKDLFKTMWMDYNVGKSDFFIGAVHPYKYQLSSYNSAGDHLQIYLNIHSSPNDGQLTWPFNGRVVITVSDKDRREACRSISRQCRIEKPPDKGRKHPDVFKFLHSELIASKLDLSRGVRVSCVITPGAR